ncbi:hypothetical protein BFJ69_g7786 [Fusarium oxysporum]|uniref:Uncharacterized protein n=1 Tax=Fusarium oxysporum TaxID=5507 RepID=A0A420N518_FUSOX|nr:hypothetical protein BFJ69_g7786 [Fusarium oxysporum]
MGWLSACLLVGTGAALLLRLRMPAVIWLGPIFKDCQLNQASGRNAPAIISTSWLGGIAKEKHWPVSHAYHRTTTGFVTNYPGVP